MIEKTPSIGLNHGEYGGQNINPIVVFLQIGQR